MTRHTARVDWALGEGEDFARGRYSRGHVLAFDGGARIAASSSPLVVPLPWSVESAVDPEELLIAALANCHMLTFLHEARNAGFTVLRYRDEALGMVGPNARGRLAVTEVELRPVATFAGRAPSADESRALHHAAHEACFIANSVTTQVRIEGRDEIA